MKNKLLKITFLAVCTGILICGCSEKKTEQKKVPKKEVAVTPKEHTNKKKTHENGIVRYANQSGVKAFDISSDTGEVLETLGLNDEVMTIGNPDQNGWYQVSINGKRGYIPGQFLSAEKITTTAAATTTPTTTPVPKDPPKEKVTTPTAPQKSTTSKANTTPIKPSTPTTKPTTPVAPTPTTPVAPIPKPVNNCPYTMMVDSTYNGHLGFFYCSKNNGSLELCDKMHNTIMENCVVDSETNEIIKYPIKHQLLVGYYDDLGQVYFWYIEK